MNDGGPAYPLFQIKYEGHDRYSSTGSRGKSLLDDFAGQIISGIMAADTQKSGFMLYDDPDEGRQKAAVCAWDMAEAMLAEKHKREAAKGSETEGEAAR